MNEKMIQYPFSDHVYFCSDEKFGICFLAIGNKLIIQKGDNFKDYSLPDSFDESYAISDNLILLVQNSTNEDLSEDYLKLY